jgi:serine/threonine protein kinase/formylglycine-generating enzyme required for sulfatase activity
MPAALPPQASVTREAGPPAAEEESHPLEPPPWPPEEDGPEAPQASVQSTIPPPAAFAPVPVPALPVALGANLPPPPAPLPPKKTRSASRDAGPSVSRDEDIPIPDFKLLRRIGSGAYGEVWLAQSITGALRAVKIVWREDFEYEKTFHREFEGIQQFEPISRGHRGLVNVLHVGWNEVRGFYYYVMELGDDAESGPQIDLATYVPRTLSTDFKRHGRLDLAFCQEAGIFLADALGYMHSYGLTHRDIKPSNIIFVDGVCKLADIGLVAMHGEHSFVGTEGFVPPEGPGSFAADIYSLGKVLYEISSGNDRMEFPAIPDDLGPEEWKLWREWNAVICKACAPDLKDRFTNAADFAEALRNVGVVRPLPLARRLWRGGWKLALSSIIVGSVLAVAKRERAWSYTIQAPEAKILSSEEIAQAKLPNANRMWLNSLDMRFSWQKDRHISDKPVSYEIFNAFLNDTGGSFEGAVESVPTKGGKPEYAVLVPAADAKAFTTWLTNRDREFLALDEDHAYESKPDPNVKRSPGTHPDWSSLKLEVVKLNFGQVTIESIPPKAEVLQKGELLGTTPLTLSRVRVGDVDFVVNLPGYKREVLKGNVKEGKLLPLLARMKPTVAVAFGRKWRNSLGMDFTPLGSVLIADTETRRADYNSFLRAQPSAPPPPVDTSSDISLPMTHVSREEAEHFCQWLTQSEQAKGLLEVGQSYRLPTDDEWSMAAGLKFSEKGDTPAERNGVAQGFYPWGLVSWPPSPVTANLWDKSAADKVKRNDGIPDFDDKFPELAPVRSFPANDNHICDLAGNVWEWVREDFGGTGNQQKFGVVRGGSWRTSAREQLLSSYRRPVPADTRSDEVGFRVIVSFDGAVAREDD